MKRRTCVMTLALTALALMALAGPAAAQQPVPIRGAYSTTFTQEPTPTPGVVLIHVQGSGQALHLGRSATAGTNQLDFRVVPAVQTGPIVFTAANGDRLEATYNGVSIGPNASGIIGLAGTITFTGGTGRFRGVTGSATLQGAASVVTMTGQFTFRGFISR